MLFLEELASSMRRQPCEVTKGMFVGCMFVGMSGHDLEIVSVTWLLCFYINLARGVGQHIYRPLWLVWVFQ